MKLDLSKIPTSRNDLKKGLILPEELTSDVTYLAGFIAGDGNLFVKKGEKYDLNLTGNFSDEKKFFDIVLVKLFQKIFSINVKAEFKGKNSYGIRIFSKGLLFFFNKIFEIPVGKKSEKIFIPKIVLASDKLTRAFIQGFADADFSLCLKKRYREVAYYPVITGASKSEKIISQISEYLNKNKIPYSLQLNYTHLDRRFNKFRIINKIHIYGGKNVYKWMTKIGFKNQKFVKIAKESILEM